MKKFLSLLIVLMLVISLFSVTAVAFAETGNGDASADGTPGDELTDEANPDDPTIGDPEDPKEGEEEPEKPEEPAHEQVFVHQYVLDNWYKANNVVIEKLQGMNKAFKLDNTWAQEQDIVEALFENINYTREPTESNPYRVAAGSDRIYWEYCAPSKEFKDQWARADMISTIYATSTGWWGFRYVLMDKNGSSSDTSVEMEEHVLARTEPFFIYISDQVAPEITKLHSDMIKAMEEGIAVGSTYTIKTNISVTDTSSTTTTYKVYKKVNGEDTLIYDSVSKEVTEGFEDCMSASGEITMLEDDVLKEGETYVYKIIYTVTDALGYVTVGNDFELTLFAVPAEDKDSMDSSQIWQIVLYVIAGLAAVGIVVVLCIKPKQPAPEGRTAPKKSNDTNSEE